MRHEGTFVCYSRNFTSNHTCQRQYLRCSLYFISKDLSTRLKFSIKPLWSSASLLHTYTWAFWGFAFDSAARCWQAPPGSPERACPTKHCKISFKRLLGQDSDSRSDETKSLLTSFLQLPSSLLEGRLGSQTREWKFMSHLECFIYHLPAHTNPFKWSVAVLSQQGMLHSAFQT